MSSTVAFVDGMASSVHALDRVGYSVTASAEGDVAPRLPLSLPADVPVCPDTAAVVGYDWIRSGVACGACAAVDSCMVCPIDVG